MIGTSITAIFRSENAKVVSCLGYNSKKKIKVKLLAGDEDQNKYPSKNFHIILLTWFKM